MTERDPEEQIKSRGPYGAKRTCTAPSEGQIMATWDEQCGQFVAWRIMRIVTDTSGNDDLLVIYLRPVAEAGHPDPAKAAANEHILRMNAQLPMYWWRLDEHYPVCVLCGSLTPCGHSTLSDRADYLLKIMSYFDNPAACPACGEVVTTRQQRRTFDDNLYVPGGPPVTFHMRKSCVHPVQGRPEECGLLHYEQKSAKVHHPTSRKASS